MMSKKHVVETMVLLVIASLFLAGFYYQNQESHHQEETTQELLLKKEEEIKQYISKTKNTTFKNTMLTSNEGEQVQLSDYKFRPKIVVFWASWCPDCQKEQKLVQIELNKEPFRLAILDAGEERVLILPEELSIIESFKISEVEDDP